MKQNWIFVAVIFCVSFLPYVKTIGFGFTSLDDDVIILNNSAIFEGKIDIVRIFTTDSSLEKQMNLLYRPLQTLSFATDTKLAGGINAWMFHLTNVLLFAFIGCSLYFLFRRFNISDKISLWGTILFVVHPMFTMPVSWIPARGDLFLTLFSILSISFFIDFVRQKKYSQLVFSALFFLFALFSKETAAILPLVFLLYFFCFQDKFKIEKKYVLFGIILLLEGVFWFYLRSISIYSEKIVFLNKHLLNIPSALSQLAVFPLDFSPLPNFILIKTVIGLILLFFLFFIVLRKDEIAKKEKIFYLMWFILFLTPIFVSPRPVGLDYLDHRFLLPIIGVFILLLSTFPKRWVSRKITFFLLLIIVVFSIISINKSNVFKNPDSFYGAVLQSNPKNALAYYNRGCVKFQIEDLSGAMDDFNKAILYDETYADAYNNRGLLKSQTEDINGAFEDFNKAILHNPQNALAYYNRGCMKIQMRDLSGAMDDFNKAVFYDETHTDAYNNRGNLKVQTGDLTGALDDYNKVIFYDKTHSDAYNNRGLLKSQMGDINGALDDCSKAIFYDSKFAIAYNSRGDLKHQTGDLEGALDDYNKAILYDNKYAAAYRNRGLLKFQTKDLPGALDDFDNAIKWQNDYAEAYYNRARTKHQMGNIDGAMDDINTAIRINPNYVEIYYSRAVLFWNLGDNNSALQDCESILKIDPNNEQAIQLKDYIIKGIKH